MMENRIPGKVMFISCNNRLEDGVSEEWGVFAQNLFTSFMVTGRVIALRSLSPLICVLPLGRLGLVSGLEIPSTLSSTRRRSRLSQEPRFS
ncbi:MAG: hypothetical protein ACETVN_05790 [Asgard group archaeon]